MRHHHLETRREAFSRIGLTLAAVMLTAGVAGWPGAVMPAAAGTPQNLGAECKTDPRLPGGPWAVHDGTRPQPVVVAPAASNLSVPPPADAVVLFDGRDFSGWRSTQESGEVGWRLEDGAMVVVPDTGSLVSRETFGDVQLHVEWATPSVVAGRGQGRGNSGVFLMRRYEIQVLDSFDNPTYPDGQAGAIYGQTPPLVNAARGPGEWQSYDIVFIAPRFEGDRVVSPARVTVFHNGVLVQHDVALIGSTVHCAVGSYQAHGEAEPLMLQNHTNPTRFRNIWARRLNGDRVR